MAQYKVPQDVEAEDKLLGPFTFRQFVYLMIGIAFIATAWALFNIFPLLALIPVPFIIFFAVLALPLKKDQPMETYLAAIVSYHLKPNTHRWEPGQRESTILITAPKKTEKPRARNITEEEASHRLSFLADLVDTEGYSIKNMTLGSSVKEEYIAEADATTDILDTTSSPAINQLVQNDQALRHAELVQQMRTAIARTEALRNTPQPITPPPLPPQPAKTLPPLLTPQPTSPTTAPSVPLTPPPTPAPISSTIPPSAPTPTPTPPPTPVNPQLANLANNKEYSIETIQKEANRLTTKDNQEIYISLH